MFKDRANYNPLVGITKFLDKGERDNMKHIGINEFPEMLDKIRGYKSQEISICLELLIHLFPRPRELRQAKWYQFDFEECVWVRPDSIMKRGIEHGTPRSTQAIKLLKTLQSISKRESEYLFPSRDSVYIKEITFYKFALQN